MATIGQVWIGLGLTGEGDFALDLKRAVDSAVRAVGKAQVPVGADTTGADLGIANLKAKLDGLTRRATEIKFDPKDKEAVAAIAGLNIKLDQLSRKIASPNITVQGRLRALKDIAEVDLAMDKLDSKNVSLLRRLAGGGGPGLGAGGLAGLIGAGGSAALLSGGVTGVAAAGLGLGIFAALAAPTLSNLKTSMSTLSGATDAYATASKNLNTAISSSPANLAAYHDGLKGLEPGLASAAKLLTDQGVTWQSLTPAQRANATALRDNTAAYKLLLPDQKTALGALLKERDAWNAMTPAQQAASSSLDKLQDGFGKLAAAAAPLTLKVLNDGLKLAGQLLPYLAPLATAAGTAIDKLVTAAGKFTQTAGFKNFMATMTSLSGPAITAIGNAVGTLAVAIGKVLLAVASPGGMAVFTGLVKGLAGVLTGLATGLSWLTRNVSPGVLQDIATAILAIYGATKLWAIAQAILDAALDANPIGLIIIALAAVTAAFIIAWKHSSTFRDVIKEVGVVFLGFAIVVVKAAKDLADSVLGSFGQILHGAADAFGWIPGIGGKLKTASKEFDKFKAGTDNVFNGMISTMQGWQDQLNASKETVAKVSASIISHFQGQSAAAKQGRTDMDNYANSVVSYGTKSDQTKALRKKLIDDLVASGQSAKDATKLVDSLGTSVTKLPASKAVKITESGSGYFTVTEGGANLGSAAHPQTSIQISAGALKSRHAAGGFIGRGTGPTADDQLIWASRGELVVPAHMVQAGAVDHLRGWLPGFAAGGIVPSYSGSIGGLPAWTAHNDAAFTGTMTAAMEKAMTAATQAAQRQAVQMAGVPVANVGSGVMRWDPLVKQALAMEGLGAYLASQVEYQMMTESGGNPNAINLTDINAQHGDPSRGLLQTIMSTFLAYHWPGTSYNIYDPLANIAAAINYARHVYGPGLMRGGMGMGSGHGYALGGLVPGMQAGGTVAQRGEQYLHAWQSRHGGPYALAIGPVVLNEQIARMTAALARAQTLAGAGGLSKGQHRFWSDAATGEGRLLATLRKELKTEQAWRYQLGLGELALDREIKAAGNLPALAGPARRWKAQLARDKRTIGEIGGMLGYTDAHNAAVRAAAAKAVADRLAAQAAARLAANPPDLTAAAPSGPLTFIPRAQVLAGQFSFDRGGTLEPGWNLMHNATGAREHLTPDGGMPSHVTIVIENRGVIGSQPEVRNWLNAEIDALARNGRLKYALTRSFSAT